LRDVDALLQAAATRGYAPIHSGVPQFAWLQQESGVSEVGSVWLCLQHSGGQRLALERTGQGRLVLQTAGERQQVHAVVYQHTVDQLSGYLTRCQLHVQTGSLANGTVPLPARPGGLTAIENVPTVHLYVQTDGCVEVTVDARDRRQCHALVTVLAEAIGGRVTAMTPACVMCPGAPWMLPASMVCEMPPGMAGV